MEDKRLRGEEMRLREQEGRRRGERQRNSHKQNKNGELFFGHAGNGKLVDRGGISVPLTEEEGKEEDAKERKNIYMKETK